MEIVQLENQLAKSNCFIIVDWDSKTCIIIDPASKDSEKEIEFVEGHSLVLDYIILTHGHADHCWGVNTLRDAYPNVKLIYSEACNQKMKKEVNLFFRLYIDDPDYRYEVAPAEIQINKENEVIYWHGNKISFNLTPGHSPGSMCIELGGKLFTGDTIMPYQPYFNGRGSSKEEWAESVKRIEREYEPNTEIYPGHGDVITLGEWTNSEYSKTK
jgi:glyoxylase-like metal-dependent hydrolase (beta-lactamase superfamily II)